jgi:predicted O-methyltransferase YrrM
VGVSGTQTGHLNYYMQYGINPVRYDTSNLQQHLERRASLYRTLGITARGLRGSRVLEVAPGTGQNSLYMARQHPRSLTLVEPNPIAGEDIEAVYRAQGAAAITPQVIPCRFEEFDTTERYDLVICENWLGDADHERQLLHKLGSFVADGGLLVITAVSPVGVLPNVLRRALANRLTSSDEPFSERTATLCAAFGPHLRSVQAMTRPATDWVQDNMLNPAYFGVLLTVPMAVAELDGQFELLGSSPRFATDWRWFKGLCGAERAFNAHYLSEYWAGLHNFLDYRTVLPPRHAGLNTELESSALKVARAVQGWEAGAVDAEDVEAAVHKVLTGIRDLPASAFSALHEFLDTFAQPDLTPDEVATMSHLAPLFGRETIYLSFEKQTNP